MQKIQYDVRVVCFVDILGFKQKINNSDSTQIKNILEKFEKFVDNSCYKTKQVTQFSDSIVFSFKYDEPSCLFHSMIDLLLLSINLVENDTLIRGAFKIGELYHDDKYIFGPALVDAYQMEEYVEYPCIAIEKKVIDLCSNFSSNPYGCDVVDGKRVINKKRATLKEERSYINSMLCFKRIKKKRLNIIDYVHYDTLVKVAGIEPDEYPSYMVNLKRIIENGLLSKDKKVIKKYVWLKNTYNDAIDDYNDKIRDGIKLLRIV